MKNNYSIVTRIIICFRGLGAGICYQKFFIELHSFNNSQIIYLSPSVPSVALFEVKYGTGMIKYMKI